MVATFFDVRKVLYPADVPGQNTSPNLKDEKGIFLEVKIFCIANHSRMPTNLGQRFYQQEVDWGRGR